MVQAQIPIGITDGLNSEFGSAEFGRMRRSGNAERGGQGDKETRRQGDKETRRQGDKETRRQGDKETRRQGDKETRRQENYSINLFPIPYSRLITYHLLLINAVCALFALAIWQGSRTIPHSPFPRIVRFWINKLHMALISVQ